MGAATATAVAAGPREDGAPARRSNAARATAPACALDRDPERLVNAYSDLILRLSYTYLRSTADAEDLCQDVLIKLIGRDKPFSSAGHERAWVVRVTINACKDQLRRTLSHAQVSLEDVPEPEAVPELPEAALTEAQSRVLRAVMSLPEAYREAIYLHYYEGYTVRGIAAVTGRSEAAVAQHLSRGRRKLRTLLEGDFDDIDA